MEKQQKIIWIIIAVVVVAALAIGGYYLWQTVHDKTTPVKVQSLPDKANAAKQAGIKAEADGNSQQALEEYQKAQDAYKQAGDKDAAADMGYKIDFMKQAIKEDQKATQEAIKNGDKPSDE